MTWLIVAVIVLAALGVCITLAIVLPDPWRLSDHGISVDAPPKPPLSPMHVSLTPLLLGAPEGTPDTIGFDPAKFLGGPIVVMPPECEVHPPLLTELEHDIVDRLGEIWNDLCTHVIGNGPSREGDLSEMCAMIHGLQRAVLKQAAARAYPDRYRLLGGVIPPRSAAEHTKEDEA